VTTKVSRHAPPLSSAVPLGTLSWKFSKSSRNEQTAEKYIKNKNFTNLETQHLSKMALPANPKPKHKHFKDFVVTYYVLAGLCMGDLKIIKLCVM
jgi:hypothetical protein